MNRCLRFIAMIVLCASFVSACSVTVTDKQSGFRYFPKTEAPSHLTVIRQDDMIREEFVMIQTLQGILAKEKPEIYITNAAYDIWLNDLIQNYGVTVDRVSDPWALLEKYKGKIAGYIEYENAGPSINAAVTLAGLKNAVAVEHSIIGKAKEIGLSGLEDVRHRDDAWTYAQFKEELSPHFIVQQSPDAANLRDYGVTHNALYFFQPAREDALNMLKHGNKDIPRLGWGPGEEFSHVGMATDNGKFTLASDWALNLSALSGVELQKPLKQPYRKKAGKKEENVHYVAFIMSDGDNVQWMLNDFARDAKWFGSPVRGQFPMGWTVPPLIHDLAPSVLSWLYENAKQDYFVSGVSGTGYFYPSSYPEDSLKLNMERLDTYLRRTDFQIVTLLDRDMPTAKVLEQYAGIPTLKGAVVYWGDTYLGGNGGIWWIKDKPFVSFRESLWDRDPVAMAKRINGYPKNPSQEGGYTLVNVHPWSRTMDDVKTLVEHMDPSVKVVSPEEFMDRIARDVKR